jgi:CheY-like chemotaxis protein
VPDAEIHADEFQAEISVREGKETILVVDDEPEIRELTEEALQSWGYTVLAAESGESALEVFSRRKSDIDLVILDLNMPGMGGIKCMEELLQTSPDIRVLIASGYSTDGQAKESVKKGASGYIAKPYRIKELMAEIRNILDARE